MAYLGWYGAPHIQTSGTHTDPGNGPAKFKKYDKNAGGGRVVAMLEEILADIPDHLWCQCESSMHNSQSNGSDDVPSARTYQSVKYHLDLQVYRNITYKSRKST